MITQQHQFIFKPGKWTGEGTVSFSASPDQLFFITKWDVSQKNEDEGILCKQEVKMEAAEEKVVNSFLLYDVTPTSFHIELENELVGKAIGTGVIDEKTIAWEFRGQIGFQGFEVYELQDDGEYTLHAEYSSPDQFRTIIDGRIRKQEKK